MKRFFATFFLVVFCTTSFAAEPDREAEFFTRAVPSVEGFAKRLLKSGEPEPSQPEPSRPEPWPNLGVRSLMDNVYILAFADRWKNGAEPKVPLHLTTPMLKLTEEMQDKNPESRTFGNLRWYWRTPEVTDQNAVEFVAAHALPVWFEAKDRLPKESREILERILRRCVDGCMKHRVSSDYTNIAIFNIVNLLLLGEAFDRPDAVKLGEERLRGLLVVLWDHGVYEYVSPTYYAPDLDTLQLGYKYVKDENTKAIFRNLLDFFWTDMAMNWFKPSLRMSGAQSRTYHYLLGTSDTTRLFAAVGLAPWDPRSNSATNLNTFGAPYRPSPEILALTDKYPRRIEQRWGAEQAQWRTTYILDDIALGTAGASYGRVKQNMILTVDLADYDAVPNEQVKLLPRNYFIADGRNDPYGVSKYPTSSAGHEKALHMDAAWIGAQRDGDALGVALYPAWTLNGEIMTNVQSHFVFRKPDAVYIDDKKIVLDRNIPVSIGDGTVVLRYGSRSIGIKIPWTRDKDGNAPKPYLIDDGNKYGVCRLTVNHWPSETPISGKDLKDAPGIAIWVRIGSHLDEDKKFDDWSRQFIAAKVDKLDVQGDSISLQISGTAGPVNLAGKALSNQTISPTVEPNGPKGILVLDGKDWGRPILERIPFVRDFSKRMADLKPIDLDSKGVTWEAESGFTLDDALVVDDDTASGGKAIRANGEFYWSLNVKESGTYYLWARVKCSDPEHDSVRIEWSEQSGDKRRSSGDWHLVRGDWQWTPLKLNNEKPVVPLELGAGPWRLIVRPREMDAQIDKFFLTTDPQEKPQP